jgi:DNA invertase Pin-like site-specific DNA recombinase
MLEVEGKGGRIRERPGHDTVSSKTVRRLTDMRAAGYLRVSSDGQVGPEHFGLDSQRAQIEAYAIANGLELVTWFEDAGISGGTLARPGLVACLKAAAHRTVDVVLVAKMDRLSRDVTDSLVIRSRFLLSNVQVVSVTEPYDPNDPAGVFFMHIMTAMGQLEKSRIKDRLSGGRKAKARQGGYAGGRPALGYTASKGGKVLTVDPVGAAAVQRVYALRSENLSLGKIAAALNQEGITTAEGSRWHESQVKRVLDRKPLYEGRYVYADVTAVQGKQQAILRG